MAISSDYPRPVNVNGYACHNCSEVAQAKKFVDPAHPKSGPFGTDASKDPTASSTAKAKAAQQAGATATSTGSDAVQFGGSLSFLNGTQSDTTTAPANAAGTGLVLDKVA